MRTSIVVEMKRGLGTVDRSFTRSHVVSTAVVIEVTSTRAVNIAPNGPLRLSRSALYEITDQDRTADIRIWCSRKQVIVVMHIPYFWPDTAGHALRSELTINIVQSRFASDERLSMRTFVSDRKVYSSGEYLPMYLEQ